MSKVLIGFKRLAEISFIVHFQNYSDCTAFIIFLVTVHCTDIFYVKNLVKPVFIAN